MQILKVYVGRCDCFKQGYAYNTLSNIRKAQSQSAALKKQTWIWQNASYV